MIKPTTLTRLFLGALALLIIAQPAPADDQRIDELKQHAKDRYRQILKLKLDGKIGETWEGYVEAVEPEFEKGAATRRLVAAENADRRELYRLLAEEQRAKVAESKRDQITASSVALGTGEYWFRKARPQEFLKVSAETWIQKNGEARYLKLLEHKKKGRIGETWEGYVRLVRRRDRDNAALLKLVEDENEARLKRYEQLAEMRSAEIDKVAQRTGEGLIADARPNDMIKLEGENWRKRKDIEG